ncbi:DedA family protein [Propionivibrio dicarboxylicus]|uniref:Membrane protein DedA, SNARE-associated domain n=1 Tax=Propionivibrio dicarboxylicus TaxID=83767 RepID=A0A1G8KWM3_9RHOO|nr:DedA family protein [Propionivibrio dicarboxylicus]SDI47763.1 membrane protein DedA, SNARE-associated domain [Propionivibrio dicarboxylicus]
MITTFVTSYGYLAVFCGTLFEGEIILIAAGFAAQRGFLAWPAVIAVAIVGAALGDQLAFLGGRRYGNRLIERFPRVLGHQARILGLLERYDVLCIVAFRFLYGLRIAGPFILGTSRVPLGRFSVVNILSVSVWTVVVVSIGRLFGVAFEALLGDLKEIEEGLIVAILLVGVGIVLGRRILAKKTPNGRERGDP